MGRQPKQPPAKPTNTAGRLTRDTVLREAIVLLDEDGLDALTMRRLAERLGVVPMALYRHVKHKDDLLDGLLDAAVSLVPLPNPSLGWRDGLSALAHAVRATMLAHPGIAAPLVTRPSLGPHGLRIGEYGLTVMRAAGFDDVDASRGPNAVLTYTIGFAALEVPRRPRDGDGGAISVNFDDLPADGFAHTRQLRPSPDEFVSDAQFEYGLAKLLDGLAVGLPHGRRGARRTALQ